MFLEFEHCEVVVKNNFLMLGLDQLWNNLGSQNEVFQYSSIILNENN